MDRLLTIKEAGNQLRLGRAKLYQLINAGAIRTVHIGRSVRIPESVLEEFIIQQTEEPREEAVMARRLTPSEIDERIAYAYNKGVEATAERFGITPGAVKALVKRHGRQEEKRQVLGYQPKPNHYPSAEEVMEALITKAHAGGDLAKQLEGAQAKIRSLESQLESEKAAKERSEALRTQEFRRNTEPFLGRSGD